MKNPKQITITNNKGQVIAIVNPQDFPLGVNSPVKRGDQLTEANYKVKRNKKGQVYTGK